MKNKKTILLLFDHLLQKILILSFQRALLQKSDLSYIYICHIGPLIIKIPKKCYYSGTIL